MPRHRSRLAFLLHAAVAIPPLALVAGCSLEPLPPTVRMQLALSPERVGPVSFLALPSRITGPGDVKTFDCLHATITDASDTSDKVCASATGFTGAMARPDAFQGAGVPMTVTTGTKTLKIFGVYFSPAVGNCPVNSLQALWAQGNSFGIFPIGTVTSLSVTTAPDQVAAVPNDYPSFSTNDLSVGCAASGNGGLAWLFYGDSGDYGSGSSVGYTDRPLDAFPSPNGSTIGQMTSLATTQIPAGQNLVAVPPKKNGTPPTLYEYHGRIDALFAASGIPTTSQLHLTVKARTGMGGSSNGFTCDGSPSLNPGGYKLSIYGKDNVWHAYAGTLNTDGSATFVVAASLAVIDEPLASGSEHTFVHASLRADIAASSFSSQCSVLEIDAASLSYSR